MLCGAGSFSHVDDDDDPSLSLTPLKGCKKKKEKLRPRRSKNPYSTVGLDKFSTVLSELGAMREKIISKSAPAGGGSMVRFMYSNSNDWIPIIVPLHEAQEPETPRRTKEERPLPPPVTAVSEPVSRSADSEIGKWARPRSHWPVVMVVILVCLVIFGRVFAICCTSAWWYVMKAEIGGDVRKPAVKKRDKRLGGGGGGGGNLVVPKRTG